MKKYNITVPQKYTKAGEEKTAWNRVGVLIEKDGKFFMSLNMFPDTKFSVFEDEPREDKNNNF